MISGVSTLPAAVIVKGIVFIPSTRSAPQSRFPQLHSKVMTPADVRILVVDDVQSMRIQVKEILRNHGFEKIQSATNGLEALKILNEERDRTHLLICDWHMAPMSGLELLREIRGKEALRGLAFVMLTAEGTKERVIEALKSGLDDYVMKPFTSEHVQLKVMNALMKKKVLG